MATRPSDLQEVFSDLDGGVFKEKIESILSIVSGAVIAHGKKGKIQINLDISQISNSHQVNIDHELKYTQPKERGQITETDKQSTPMSVNKGGKLTLFPEDQMQMFGRNGEPTTHHTISKEWIYA